MRVNKNLSAALSALTVVLCVLGALASFLVLHIPANGILLLFLLIPLFHCTHPDDFKALLLRSSFQYFLLFVGLCSLSVLAQNFFINDVRDADGRSVHIFTSSTLLVGCLWAVAGAGVSNFMAERNLYTPLVLIGLCDLIVLPTLDGGFLISYYDLAESGTEGVNHLLIAELIVLLSFYCFAFSGYWFRSFVIANAALLLFAAGGRSTLYFGLLVMLAAVLRTGSKVSGVLIVGSVILSLVVAFFFVGIDSGDTLVARMLFSDGLSKDDSFSGRDEVLRSSLSNLPEQFLFGDPTLFVSQFGTIGSYVHNIISAWQFFGFFPFALLVYILIFNARKIAKLDLRTADPVTIFGVLCFSYATLGVIFSKFIGFPALWFSLGFWSTWIRSRALPRSS